MDLRPISDGLNKNLVETQKELWKNAVRKDWYFSGWLQKTFILFCFLFTIGSGIYYAWRFLI